MTKICRPIAAAALVAAAISGAATAKEGPGYWQGVQAAGVPRAVGREQTDASIALGLPRSVRIVHVILPQTELRAAPKHLSNGISLFKESALVSAVGMADLMFIGQNISNNTARPVEVLTAVALIYFVIAFLLTRFVTRIERGMLRRFAV